MHCSAGKFEQERAVDTRLELESFRGDLVSSHESAALKLASSKYTDALARRGAEEARLTELTRLKAQLGASAWRYDADRAQWDGLYTREGARWADASPAPREWLGLASPYSTLGARTIAEQCDKQATRTGNLQRALQQLDRAGERGAALQRSQLELSLGWAQQNLAELQRAEAQLGPQSPPVVMGQWVLSPGAG